MTAVVPRGEALTIVEHELEGRVDDIRAVLQLHRTRGTLVGFDDMRRLGHQRIAVRIRVVEPRGKSFHVRRWSRRRTTVIACAAAGMTLLGVIVWAIVTIVAAVMAWLAANVMVIVGAVILLGLAGGVGGCTTIVKVTHRHW